MGFTLYNTALLFTIVGVLRTTILGVKQEMFSSFPGTGVENAIGCRFVSISGLQTFTPMNEFQNGSCIWEINKRDSTDN